jgi:hypothetical protein
MACIFFFALLTLEWRGLEGISTTLPVKESRVEMVQLEAD